MRKTPYRHPVSGHTRSGKFVDHYVRGKGKKPVIGDSFTHLSARSGFKVTLYYGERKEIRSVQAGTFTEAITAAFMQNGGEPSRVKVRRLSD